MPIMGKGQKPTVAIITSKYNEKLAVDAMMEDKTTFVKYKTEGMYRVGQSFCQSFRYVQAQSFDQSIIYSCI